MYICVQKVPIKRSIRHPSPAVYALRPGLEPRLFSDLPVCGIPHLRRNYEENVEDNHDYGEGNVLLTEEREWWSSVRATPA